MTTDSQNNTSETLRQGAKFKKYQNKIINSVAKKHKKLLEGFESGSNIEKSENLINQANVVQNAAQELQQLQTQFTGLLGRYQTANTQLMTTTNTFLNTPRVTDATKGKNVFVNQVVANPASNYIGAYADNAATPAMNKLTSKTAGYTFAECQQEAINTGKNVFGLQGVNVTTQKASCSTSSTLSQAEKYGVAGANCILGSDGNLYGGNLTNAIYQVPDAQFVGTYGDNPNRAMPTFANGGSRTYTYESCKQAAISGTYPLFALQWYSGGSDGAAQCALSNDFTAASQYGQSGSQGVDGQGQIVGGGWANAIYQVQSSGTYIGCYNDNATIPAMANVHDGATNFSVDTCQQFAIQGGYKYYGLQNGTAGTSKCYVSNSLPESTKYGASTPTINLTDGKAYGNNLVNAVYEVTSIGYPENMGKVGHVNDSGLLSEYPSTMFNVVSNAPVINGLDDSCSNDIININSVQWKGYTQTADKMSPTTKCGLGSAIQADQSSASDLGAQLKIMSARIILLINYLESLDSNIIEQTGINKASLDDMLQQYTQYNSKFSQYKSTEVKNINGILTDSNIVATHENYSYILWSVLAISVIIVTVTLIRRNK